MTDALSSPDTGELATYAIGELAEKTGIKVVTIRFYEREGLLPPPPRTPGGHRLYDGKALKRLFFIARARALGFPLARVRLLLSLADGALAGGENACAEAERLAARHLAEVQEKVRELQALERVLKDMVERCREDSLPDCPLIETLFRAGRSAPQEGLGDPVPIKA